MTLENMSPTPGMDFCALEHVASETVGLLLGSGHTEGPNRIRLTDEMDEGMLEFSFLSDDLPRIEWNVEGMAGPPAAWTWLNVDNRWQRGIVL